MTTELISSQTAPPSSAAPSSSTSAPAGSAPPTPDAATIAAARARRATPRRVAGREYWHSVLDVRRRNAAPRQRLHVFYPEEVVRDVSRRAAYVPLAAGGLSLLLVTALASWIAARVSRPLTRLRERVSRIARGDFERVEDDAGCAEVRDLAAAVNGMAQRLGEYNQQARTFERLRTLDQLGGGLAHHLRNAATGARMAIDVHRGECPDDNAHESLDVAARQLELMERYLHRFLALGSRRARRREVLDLAALLNSVVPLVGPAARHTGVRLEVRLPDGPQRVEGELDGLEQVVLNLLLNAIEAAAAVPVQPGGRSGDAWVELVVEPAGGDCIALHVRDNGAGPTAAVQCRLFDAFVTDKSDGTGLGLAIVQEEVTRHGGTVTWSREDRITQFTVELPRCAVGRSHVEVAGG